MIREIKNDVTAAIQEAFTCALHTNPGSFVLFLARGDYNHLFDGDRFANLDPKPSPYCLDFMPDIYRDETRNKFYVRYLNRRYKNDNFKYDGDEGIDDLCVEMMIYSHTWESVVFIKDLYRLSNIVSGQEFYDWDVTKKDFHGYSIITDTRDRFMGPCPLPRSSPGTSWPSLRKAAASLAPRPRSPAPTCSPVSTTGSSPAAASLP